MSATIMICGDDPQLTEQLRRIIAGALHEYDVPTEEVPDVVDTGYLLVCRKKKCVVEVGCANMNEGEQA